MFWALVAGSAAATEAVADAYRRRMPMIQEAVTDEEVEQMIQEADADGDGELSFEDFMQFIGRKGLL